MAGQSGPGMYRRPKFLELLLEVRQEMAREADYDSDLFAEIVRTGARPNLPGGGDGPEKPEPAKRKRPSQKP